ncbi:MAG: shikimate dehydrogenase [Candidatus Eisenbacteria bacterium]
MIDSETRVLGVIGDPVSHSLSPAIQNAALEHLHMNARYFAFPVARERLREMTDAVRVLRMPGLNVTLPHKEAILPLLDRLGPEAARVGAVNTVVNREGVLEGENTDVHGFREALRRVRRRGMKTALVLGKGGAARAVFLVLMEQGFSEILVACRRLAQGRKMVESLGGGSVGRVIPWDAREKAEADLLVNATPLGTNVRDPLPAPARVVRGAKGAIDLVVRPRGTRWVALCRSYGIPAEDGSIMLVAQGRESLRLWFGKTPSFEVMLRALRAGGGAGS